MKNPFLILSVDLGTSSMKVALITAHGQVLGWESEPVQLIITSDGGAEQSPGRLVAGIPGRGGAAAGARAGPAAGGARSVLLHPGRGHPAGGCGRQTPDELHPVDGHARRPAPEAAVPRHAQPHRPGPAQHPALDSPDRRYAFPDRQRPRRAHAVDPRPFPRNLRPHL